MKALKRFRLGEAVLWLGFVLFGFAAANGTDEAMTLAGLCVLAAIGVRATRSDLVAERPDEIE